MDEGRRDLNEVEPYFSYYILTLLHLTYPDSGAV